MIRYLAQFSGPERAVIAVSLTLAAFLVVDPLVLQVVRSFDPGTRQFFKSFTDLGKSGWILIPTGVAVIGLYLFRSREYRFRAAAAAGYLMQIAAFVFVAVAGASLSASLIKNILGRARPKFFDELGSVAFQPFTFDYAYASFPSGHATTIVALAMALALLWPRGRVYLLAAAGWVAASRFLLGSHYLSDALAGAALGAAFPWLLRDRLAARGWLFRARADGGVSLRGRGLLRWIGREVRHFLPLRGNSMAQPDAGDIFDR